MMVGHPVLENGLSDGPGVGARKDWGASEGAFVVTLGASATLLESLCAVAPVAKLACQKRNDQQQGTT